MPEIHIQIACDGDGLPTPAELISIEPRRVALTLGGVVAGGALGSLAGHTLSRCTPASALSCEDSTAAYVLSVLVGAALCAASARGPETASARRSSPRTPGPRADHAALRAVTAVRYDGSASTSTASTSHSAFFLPS
jgi:hypothetical protein